MNVVQIADYSVAVGDGATTTERGQILFRTIRGASLDLRMNGDVCVTGVPVGTDRDLYQVFHWLFGIPFAQSERSTDPFRWETRKDEQSARLREIVRVFEDDDVIVVASPEALTPLSNLTFPLEPGSIVFRNAVGMTVRILADGRVIVDNRELVSGKDVYANSRIILCLKELLLMDERSM